MRIARSIIGILIIVYCIPCALIFTGCGSESTGTEFELPPDYQWYTNSDFNYKVAYPQDWILVPAEDLSPSKDILSSAMIKYDDDISLGSILINVASDYDIDEALESGATREVVNGMDYYHLYLENILGTNQRLAIFPVEGRYYVVQCFALPDYYQTHIEVFDNAINSFTILNGSTS